MGKIVYYNDNFLKNRTFGEAIISNRKFIKELHTNFADSVFTRVMARMDELAFLIADTKKLISKVVVFHQESCVNLKSL